MSSTDRRSRVLVADTVRAHRWGVVTWIIGAAVAMYAIAAGFASEVARFSGGARAMATSMQAGAEALRLLRWPAERLDTLGGYLTYHNVTLFSLALSVYAAVQGAHAVRGAEDQGLPAEILATGRPRGAVLADRAAGFAVTLTLICLGLGGGLALAMVAGGEGDLGGSFITALAVGLCAFVAYAMGLLISQLTPSARAGTAAAALLLTVLYLVTNVWQRLGPLGGIRFVSPFYYANFSRALVPGHGLHIMASVAMVVAGVLLLMGAAWAYQRRDYAAGLWARRAGPSRPVRQVQRPALQAIWSATLLRQRAGLLVWSAAAAAYLAMMAWMEPSVADMWEDFRITQVILGDRQDLSIDAQYLAFAGQLIVPFVIGYVITQAAGWVNDLHQGRVELILATPVSWPRLVWQRLLANVAGAAAITAAAIAGLAITAVAVGVDVSALGLVRLAAVTVLLTAALSAVAALIVAWLHNHVAVTVLAIIVAGSYLLVYLVPLFAWPDWVSRISVFGAYANPYLELPTWTGLAVLATMALAGGAGAAALAQRSPKTASS